MTFRELDPPQPRRVDLRLLVLAAAVFAIVVLTSPVAAASNGAMQPSAGLPDSVPAEAEHFDREPFWPAESLAR